jgi:hypothetical protein
MVKHITLWKLKDFAAGNDKETNYKIIKERSIALAKQFPRLCNIEIGRGFKSGGQNYDIGMVLEFESKEALEEYLAFPGHKTMHEFAVEVRGERAVIDYVVGE